MPGKRRAVTTDVASDTLLHVPEKVPTKAKEMFTRVMIVAELLAKSEQGQPQRLTRNVAAKTQK
jgi:hypothetical protein